MKSDLSRKIAVITGASSGIGAETALEFARRRYNVVLAARRADRLEEVARQCRLIGVSALPIVTDVSRRDEVKRLIEMTMVEFKRLDVMVNNAGYGLFGAADELDEEKLRAIFDVNFYGAWYGLCEAAAVMKRQGWGHIFNVSSVIGKRATPMHGAYCATKFAMSGLTESARVELLPHNIHVTLVCPALTATEFFGSRSMDGRENSRMKFTKFHAPMDPARVAAGIARYAGKRKPEIIFSFGGRMLVKLAALSPRLADWIMEFYRRDLVE